jgi:hypothetical protein
VFARRELVSTSLEVALIAAREGNCGVLVHAAAETSFDLCDALENAPRAIMLDE